MENMFKAFQDMMNESIEGFELSPEEIKKRQEEIENMDDETKEDLMDLMGKDNYRYLKLLDLITNIGQEMYEKEEDDDSAFEEMHMSDQFLTFINYILNLRDKGLLYTKYRNNIEIFETILNDGLDNEDINNIFHYMTPEQRKASGMDANNMPLSGLEEESLQRLDLLCESEKDLVQLFNTITMHEGMSWESFKGYLK